MNTAHAKNLVLLPLFALFFSPLIHTSTQDSFLPSLTCCWLLLFLSAFLAFFFLHPFRVHIRTAGVGAILALAGIVSISLLIGTYAPRPLAAVLYLTSILFLLFSLSIRENNRLRSVLPIILIGCIGLYAQWGIAQFIVQQDLGMVRIGESHLAPGTAGIATFSVGQIKYLRSYGPFAHANAFGGVLLLGTILLFMQRKRLAAQPFFHLLILLFTIGILTSFSRTAIVGLGGLLVLLAWEKRWAIIIPIGIVFILFAPALFARSFDPHSVAVQDRATGASWFREIMTAQSAIQGFGIGNYSSALLEYLERSNIPHDPWDIAPVHSVPALLFAELGIVLLLPIAAYGISLLRAPRARILFLLVPALFLDHYFATQLGPLAYLIITASIVVQ